MRASLPVRPRAAPTPGGNSTLKHINRYQIICIAALAALGVMLLLTVKLHQMARVQRELAEALKTRAQPEPTPSPAAAGHPPAGRPKVPVEPGSPLEEYLDALNYYALQLDAIIIDMNLYLEWAPKEKELMKPAAQQALARLAELRKGATALTVPKTCAGLTDAFAQTASALEAIYTDVADKPQEQLDKETAAFTERCNGYTQIRAGFERSYLNRDDVAAPEPGTGIEPPEDAQKYDEALKLMEEKRYEDAYDILTDLRGRHPDNAPILLGITDCMMRADVNGEEWIQGMPEPEQQAIAILAGILDRQQYSPVLFEAFIKWRTLTQAHMHGVSNYSEIPNWEYNEKRQQVIQAIKGYMKDHPDDLWARLQKDTLLFYPNIKRGGTMGNSNLMLWGVLYGLDRLENVLKESSEQKDAQGEAEPEPAVGE